MVTNRRVVAKVGDVIDGQTLTTVLDEDSVPNINRHGQVSYRAGFYDEAPFSHVNTLVFDNHIIAQPGKNIGGHVLGSNMSQGASLDDMGRAIFWAATANSAETGVAYGLFSQHGLLWLSGPQQNVLHYVSRNGRHWAMDVAFRDDSVPSGQVRAIATPDEILLREGQFIEGNLEVKSLQPMFITNDGEIYAVVHSLLPTGQFRTDHVLLPEFIDFYSAADVPEDRLIGIPTPLDERKFAYLATLPGGAQRGVYVGSELIVAVGDIVSGKTIHDLGTAFGPSLAGNSLGNIVMVASFTDGTQAYLTATVVPEPSSVVLAIAAIMLGIGMCARGGPLRAKPTPPVV